ncbi:hypothetical protein ACS8E6_01115 [Salinicola halophyticus]|uniref:hypothetical protein n=1 Tax=Salinicola halophyticus TaxID=1808881 RepID=UPI003F47F2CE
MADAIEQTYIEIPINLFFDTKEPIAIKDVIESLKGIEQLSKRVPELLHHLTGIEFGNYELAVSKIEEGSLDEIILLKFLEDPRLKQQLEKFKREHPQLTKAGYVTIGSIAILLLIGNAYTVLDNFLGNESQSISSSYNTNINITAQNLNLSPLQVEDAVKQTASHNRKKLVQNVLATTSPVAGHKNASIGIGKGDSTIKIPEETVGRVDFSANLNATNKDIPYEFVDMTVVTLNRENPNVGWQARIPSIGEKLLKLEFGEKINPSDFQFNPYYKVDVIVTYRNDIDHASLVAQKATVTKLYRNGESVASAEEQGDS